jgi:aspartate aminotransferase
MVEWGAHGNTIRVISEYADDLAKKIGSENIYNFSIGNPSVDPPKEVNETIQRLITTLPPVKLHSYTPAPGLPEVREKMAAFVSESYGKHYDADDIFMTAGACGALAVVIHAINCPGDEVITFTPYFSEYRVFAESAGATLIEVPSRPEDLQPDMDALRKSVNEKTSSIVINSPNNPSGVVIKEEYVKAIAELLKEKSSEYGHPIYIIADEPYRDLIYDGIEVPFFPNYYPDTIYCYSFSKSMSIPGERVGLLAIAKDCTNRETVMHAIAGATRAFGYLNVSGLFQLVVTACLGKTSDNTQYIVNRDFIYNSLTELGYTCIRPDGAFYLFLKLPDGREDFCRRAMELGVMLVPGKDFSYPGFARLAYCVPLERLQGSIHVFKQLADEYGVSPKDNNL